MMENVATVTIDNLQKSEAVQFLSSLGPHKLYNSEEERLALEESLANNQYSTRMLMDIYKTWDYKTDMFNKHINFMDSDKLKFSKT